MTTDPTRDVATEDGGAVIYFLIAVATVGMLMFALVADGSRVLADLSETSDVAQIAARSGAREVDPSTGRLDTDRATAAANRELIDAGMTGTVNVAATSVTVTASHTLDLTLLAAVGINRHTVTSTRTADLLDRPGAP